MLPKNFTLILTFLFDFTWKYRFAKFLLWSFYSLQYCAFMIFKTPSFSSPMLEENAAGVRNDTFTCTAASSKLLNQKIQVNKSKSFTNFAFKTVLCFFKTLTVFFCSMFSFKLRNKIGRFSKLILFTELVLPS